ncbi:MAG: hypothetical protein LUF28_08485 [Clostridiales bacterium]|nr:hypothetical protein [Clostridiales bacterium]
MKRLWNRLLPAALALAALLTGCGSSEYEISEGRYQVVLEGDEYSIYQWVGDELHEDDGENLTSSAYADAYYRFPVYPTDYVVEDGAEAAELTLDAAYNVETEYTDIEEFFEALDEGFSDYYTNYVRQENEEIGGLTYFVYEYDGTATSGDTYHAYGHVTLAYGFSAAFTAYEYTDWDIHITYEEVSEILEKVYALDIRENESEEESSDSSASSGVTAETMAAASSDTTAEEE